MAKKIVWSLNASQEFLDILSYLETKWSFKVADDFSTMVERKLQLISDFPHLGLVSEQFPTRKKVTITKRCILIYAIEEENLILLSFFDTRRDPADQAF